PVPDARPPRIYTLSLHDALPISGSGSTLSPIDSLKNVGHAGKARRPFDPFQRSQSRRVSAPSDPVQKPLPPLGNVDRPTPYGSYRVTDPRGSRVLDPSQEAVNDPHGPVPTRRNLTANPQRGLFPDPVEEVGYRPNRPVPGC